MKLYTILKKFQEQKGDDTDMSLIKQVIRAMQISYQPATEAGLLLH